MFLAGGAIDKGPLQPLWRAAFQRSHELGQPGPCPSTDSFAPRNVRLRPKADVETGKVLRTKT
jgi:hypothetical protein